MESTVFTSYASTHGCESTKNSWRDLPDVLLQFIEACSFILGIQKAMIYLIELMFIRVV